MTPELTAGLIEFNWTLLMHLATVLVLFLVVKKFFFEKIHAFMENREQTVRDAFDNAELTNRKADEKMAAFQKRIAGVESEGREIIRQAKIKADDQALEILDKAKQEAELILQKAKRDVEREKQLAETEMKEQIVNLSQLMARKILERELTRVDHEGIIDEIISESGVSQWKH